MSHCRGSCRGVECHVALHRSCPQFFTIFKSGDVADANSNRWYMRLITAP